MSGMKVKELMDSLKGDCYRFRVHYPEEWEFGLITGATFFGKRGLALQHGEDDVSSFTLNPSWLSCEDETQRCIMVEIYLEPYGCARGVSPCARGRSAQGMLSVVTSGSSTCSSGTGNCT